MPIPFAFESPTDIPPDARVASVPAGIVDRLNLFAALERDLRFPYFGDNWDSLGELLAYGWEESPGTPSLAIIHGDLPALGPHHTRVYLDVLRRAVRERQRHAWASLYVSFPESTREQVEALLAGESDPG